MYEQIVPKVLNKFGIEYKTVLPAQKGYRNESYPVELQTGQTLNIIFYKREPKILNRINEADRVSGFLSQKGLPSRKRIDPRLITLATTPVTYVGLYNYLPGHTIPWESYTQAHIKLLGKTMGDMHADLRPLAKQNLPLIANECLGQLVRMQQYFSQTGVMKAMHKKLSLELTIEFDYFQKILDASKRLKHQQPLHMDFVRSNVLFKQNKEPVISGIIDFEKAAYGHPLYDVARTLAFLLVDCKYKDSDKVKKYFLWSGYNKRSESKLPKVKLKTDSIMIDLLDELTKYFLFYDFFKFLLHNPYEFLCQNEHFVRTTDALRVRNMLN